MNIWLLILLSILQTDLSAMPVITLYDFDTPEEINDWFAVNDGVMGGISSSKILSSLDSFAVFSGIVSLENKGGFASVRTRKLNKIIEDKTGIIIRLMGDGNHYSFRLRNNSQFDGVAYAQSFPTRSGEWSEVKLPFNTFTPVFRGRRVSGLREIKSEEIRQIGFLISDKQEGDFSLTIDWIKVY